MHKINFDQNIDSVQFIKPSLNKKLKIHFGHRIIDYLLTFPKNINFKNYIQRPISIADLKKQITIDITVKSMKKGFLKSPSTITCVNKFGQRINILYFNISQKFLTERYKKGEILRITGTLHIFKDIFQVSHPNSILDVSKFQSFSEFEPIYNLRGMNIKQKQFLELIKRSIIKFDELKFDEWIQKKILLKYKWSTFSESLKSIHTPKTKNILDLEKFRKRLAFDEVLSNLIAVNSFKKKNSFSSNKIFIKNATLSNKIISTLNFSLTNDQKFAYKQINNDLNDKKSMFRLLQGDVGSGKTIISLLTISDVLNSGYQAALMVPSEILARQHFNYFSTVLKKYGFKIKLLTGKVSIKEKKEICIDLKNHKIDLLIGTHSLFNKDLNFSELGIIVIDEQHKFGVSQRLNLINKSENSNVLIMSATPIPRSLTFVVYGEIDISIIKEKPKSRKNTNTSIVGPKKLKELISGLKRLIKKNEKIFWVLPEIGIDEESDSQSTVIKRYKYLFKEFGEKVNFIHGKMKKELINDKIYKFKNEQIMILVSTTLIEVGIDIPEATTIVIEEPNKFGLAQLHQLRGRVGRNNLISNCILFHNDKMSDNAKKRLEIMRMSNDGFFIAQKDLEIRGGGDMFGTKQTGLPSWRFFNPYNDIELIEEIKENLISLIEKKKRIKNLISIFFNKSKFDYFFSG
ncbi:MAG: ATP-dependent DNA helicase RecG [Rickettsiales bacterium]|nr:ATP-dependent DNA helicase RecG [Rickettsiales bacterium]